MITATQARAMATTLNINEDSENFVRALKVCSTWEKDIRWAIKLGKNRVVVNGIAKKLKAHVMNIFKGWGFDVSENRYGNIVLEW